MALLRGSHSRRSTGCRDRNREAVFAIVHLSLVQLKPEVDPIEVDYKLFRICPWECIVAVEPRGMGAFSFLLEAVERLRWINLCRFPAHAVP